MYPQNEGPRKSEEEITNTLSAQPANTHLSGNDTRDNLDTVGNSAEPEAVSTRTPERWWLRKRLMQG